MKQNLHLRKQYSWVLIVLMLIGTLAGLYLLRERNQVEMAQHQIENIMDYDAVLRSASYEKRSTDEVLAELKSIGVTSMAIYDRTLEKANDAGDVSVIRPKDMGNIKFYGSEVLPGATYIAAVPGKEAQFREIWEDLVYRLGTNKVGVRQTDHGVMIELQQPYTSLMDMNLSISRVQAMEVSNRGFNVVVRPGNFKGVTRDDVNLVFNRIKGVPNVTAMVFTGKEALGYPTLLNDTLKRLKEQRIALVGIESTSQLQYEPQAGFPELAAMSDYSTGRLYTIAKDELKKTDPEEVAQKFYITDLERNVRFNLFPIYETGVDNETALGTTMTYIKAFREKMADRHFTYGRGSVYPPYKPALIPLCLTMLGAVAMFVFVLSLFVPLKMKQQMLLVSTLAFVTFIVFALTSGALLAQLLSLSSAILAPVGALVLVMDCWCARQDRPAVGPWRATGEAVLYTAATALMAAIGAIYIGAIMGNTRFFMEFAIFRGVKLTFVMPILLTAIAYLQRFPLWKGNAITSGAEAKTFIKEFLMADIKVYTLVIVGLMAAVAWVFLGRSGHTAGVPVPALELTMRRFLENTLYARPREKEFLIGHPALMLAAFAFLRKWPLIIHFLFTVAAAIGVGSMVETFCHIRTPVMMSIMRGLDGLWMGIIFGLVGILFFRFTGYVAKWYHSRGGEE